MPRALPLASLPLLAACVHTAVPPTTARAPRIDSPRTQSVLADVPAPIASLTRISHDASVASLDREHACFRVTLRATTGESARLHAPAAWSPRLEIDGHRSEIEIEPASLRVLQFDDEEVRAVRLVRNPEPITCGASAWSTLTPLAPLLYVALVPSLIWLATEMPRHDRLCRASERTHLESDDDSEVESVHAEMCFASSAFASAPESMELRVNDPVRDGVPVRFRWRIAH